MKNKKISVLFLGASKRVSLFERFIDAAQSESVNIELFSCESKDDFFPVSNIAKILVGPKFNDIGFSSWLISIIDQHSIDIIIPNMDSATVVVSKILESNFISKSYLVVSSNFLCKVMEDKILAADFFKSNNLPIVENDNDFFPKIIKYRKGYGSKGIYFVHNHEELQKISSEININDYLIQNFISARETTVDMHISKKGDLVGYVLRDRLEISDGEVMACETRLPNKSEKHMLEAISRIPGWLGCITIQYFTNEEDGQIFINEINPRFGGGVTCSIEAGLDIPRNILREYLGRDVIKMQTFKKIYMTRSRRDFFYEK
jgi:carbamoyl-phosphate synthase large subunit